jgi:AcrR family transcriptional regulator
VFAERGFAGARIDEIAARAGMAKSHVYYHFEGKQDLLERLVALRVSELLARKQAVLAGVTEATPAAIARVVPRVVRELLVPHERFLRIVLIESLGRADDEPLLLQVLRPVFDDALRRIEATGAEVDRERFLSDFFHFGVLPAVVHVALGERWAKVLRVSRARALELLIERLVELRVFDLRRKARQGRAQPGGQR